MRDINIKNVFLGLIIFAGVLFLIGTFYDFQISQILVGKITWYGEFFAIFGLLPLSIVKTISYLYFARVIEVDEQILNYVCKLPFLYLAYKACYSGIMQVVMMYKMEMNLSMDAGTLMLVIITILSLLIIALGFKYAYSFDRKKIVVLAKRMVFALVIVFVVNQEVTFIKTHVGRARYYAVMASDAVSYTPWYHVNGLTDNNDFMSFISGHTTSAYMLVLTGFMVTDKRLANILYISGIASGLIVALSRIVLGQHYVTDTMGSMLIMTFTIFLGMKLFKIKFDLSDLNKSAGIEDL